MGKQKSDWQKKINNDIIHPVVVYAIKKIAAEYSNYYTNFSIDNDKSYGMNYKYYINSDLGDNISIKHYVLLCAKNNVYYTNYVINIETKLNKKQYIIMSINIYNDVINANISCLSQRYYMLCRDLIEILQYDIKGTLAAVS